MSPESRERCDRDEAGSACDERESELVLLLENMLGVMQRCQEMVLQAESESQQVIRRAVGHLCAGGSSGRVISCERLVPGLDRLLARLLESSEDSFPRGALLPEQRAGPTGIREMARCWEGLAEPAPLADWFCVLEVRLREAHPRAVEILRWRLAGLGRREIAERLELPPRLVGSVLAGLYWSTGGMQAMPGATA